ncbi:transporter suffix domain-containing protein [Metasolibacillus meyeri]|uniref:Transporter suffix domain-containing protein n=1 Tax=Metasolibacillus meyeri TaxID=1071052 RepID=A0AAW9NW67_9BACL|nr:transporter suffix domain-containing protein [Metasolibacillus meyeri]MEC1180583.1 transporter suffix domain-containing protein [Metasolibacillus meyeri]
MGKEIVSNEKKPLLFKLGIGLLMMWGILWIAALITPFTPLATPTKAVVASGCIIVGEILFLIGAVFVGKEVVAKYKSYLNPKNWRKKDKYEE